MTRRHIGRKIRYLLDRLLVRNPLWQLMILVLLSALVVTLGMILVERHVNGEDGETTFWWSLTRLMDQGTFIDDFREDAHTRWVAVSLTLCGLLVMSTLIGTVSSKINARLDRLRRGRSPVEEKDHLIVCGSGDRLYEIARELLVAAADEPRMRRSPVVLFSGATRE